MYLSILIDIAVIGAGGWGTTLANLLAEKGHKVKLWAHEKEVVDEINDKKENSGFLPGIELSSNLEATDILEDAIKGIGFIVTVVPSSFLRSVAKEISKYVLDGAIVVSATKGIEEVSFKRMSEILEDELGDVKIAALSGPNHAEEVSKKTPTATVIASKHQDILDNIKEVFETSYFKVYPHSDIVGIEICGAIKNITAIAVGVCDSLKVGDNAKASIITLGLMEMSNVGKFFGAKRSTFYGLAGVGDLVATCTSKHSRNRAVGEMIAQGKDFDAIKEEMHGMVAEGIKTTKAVYDLAKKNDIDLPLTKQVYNVIYEKKELKKAIKDLIALI